MATSDAEQKSDMVRYRTRMAQGVKLDGTSLQPTGGNQPKKPQGGLAHSKKK